jgi:negative regulator of sigma E activity
MTRDRDAELSALLDGALSAAEEMALRAEIARDPALAARLEALARVDAALRALPARPVPLDLRARLQAKLAAEAAPTAPPIRAGAPARASRRRAWRAGFAAAAAAAAAAVLVVVSRPSDPTGGGGLRGEVATTRAPQSAGDTGDAAASVASERAVPDPARAAAQSPGPVPSEIEAGSPALLARGENAPLPAAPEPMPAGTAPAAGDTRATPLGSDPGAVALAPTGPIGTAPASGDTEVPVRLAVAPTPAIVIEVTDDEADALGELEPADAEIVAVLDWLGELEALEAEAS